MVAVIRDGEVDIMAVHIPLDDVKRMRTQTYHESQPHVQRFMTRRQKRRFRQSGVGIF
jgi:hypothetical protein